MAYDSRWTKKLRKPKLVKRIWNYRGIASVSLNCWLWRISGLIKVWRKNFFSFFKFVSIYLLYVLELFKLSHTLFNLICTCKDGILKLNSYPINNMLEFLNFIYLFVLLSSPKLRLHRKVATNLKLMWIQCFNISFGETWGKYTLEITYFYKDMVLMARPEREDGVNDILHTSQKEDIVLKF